jgi:hypothetical protein
MKEGCVADMCHCLVWLTVNFTLKLLHLAQLYDSRLLDNQ